jgi:hypothetical protein
MNRDTMNEKLPAPCEHCGATGISRGIECKECSGKGYQLIIAGRQQPKRFGCTGGHIGLHAAADLEISEKELPNKVSLHQSKINDC